MNDLQASTLCQAPVVSCGATKASVVSPMLSLRFPRMSSFRPPSTSNRKRGGPRHSRRHPYDGVHGGIRILLTSVGVATDLVVMCDAFGRSTTCHEVRALVGFSGAVTWVCDRCRGKA
jgi:hypothetical protein